MLHEYIDIPAQPQPLQEMLWKRQELVGKLGRAAASLCEATVEHIDLVNQIIQMNDLIRREEQKDE